MLNTRMTFEQVEALRMVTSRYDSILQPFAPIPQCEPDPGTSFWHLRWMILELNKGEMPLDKAHRWLGFIQGVMAINRLIAVPIERELTRPIFSKIG